MKDRILNNMHERCTTCHHDKGLHLDGNGRCTVGDVGNCPCGIYTSVERPELPAFDWKRMEEIAADDYCETDIHEEYDKTCAACLAIRGTRWALQMRSQLHTAQSRIRELEQETGMLQRTMKFWEQSYIAEHGHWGRCSNLERAEKAEAERDALQELLGMDERGVAAIKNILAERDQPLLKIAKLEEK